MNMVIVLKSGQSFTVQSVNPTEFLQQIDDCINGSQKIKPVNEKTIKAEGNFLVVVDEIAAVHPEQ